MVVLEEENIREDVGCRVCRVEGGVYGCRS